ncbi:flagellar protein export ATPase FliI [Marinomonas mediterranea]|uniref:Flagellum-specific ATP synthase n=1 Tax=Marinomonas mediterranea (strain ATCC 700492 / JCM 21426 / NBRC 103028 / MMB-1) TaxID=717774 RepID=F2K3L2_MARM1|nr:flagellar protein export ATPase FliI [Marinomonas mediterranea]ADZ92451.1 flagellar protein export ATPase FliI [Marinomonas mediterranea MMB-1]WCN10401.1 flagellar protein export ATPase FliI [Marinomonas mediterranea]WCN14447.1 flagellar protein export ATPase FliI [Marinomonas mediterranea]WCN18499.1 flagellar protein export ATPase FliI [Marinomonas mediterranea MMB-1]
MPSILERMSRLDSLNVRVSSPIVEGKVTRMVGLTMEAVGCKVALGDRCNVQVGASKWVESEVVGFNGKLTYLMPTEAIEGIAPGARVVPLDDDSRMPVGDHLLGRVINGLGRPLDGRGPITSDESISLQGEIINPLQRKPISDTLDVGIKTINSLLTVGKGQRLGLFAGSGVGKSMLLGMMTRFTEADITIVGLIGERGREVKEFIEQILGEEGLAKSVVIASPADDSALMRLRAAMLTTRIAEYFRDQGRNVLLLMDSLTRYAQAQREIALSVGEPPATKGYPPSVFSKLPQLVERAGNGKEGGGSITAFYTVLTEGDDQQDPIADASRAILDGHIVLSRRLAEEGHYPAIDIEASISRAMPHIVSSEHLQGAMRVKQLYSKFQQNRDLISVGAYSKGSDPDLDQAIMLMPDINDFLRQSLSESFNLEQSLEKLVQALTSNQQIANKT